MLGVENSRSTIQLRVFDWNRFSSNKPLGTVNIDLSSLTLNAFYDDWRTLDTQGELRVIIHTCQISIAKPLSLGQRLGSARLQLESSVAYPGQTVRGCFMFGTQKVRKYHAVRIIVEGHSRTYWSTGSGKHRRHHHGAAMLFNCTAAMAGSAVDKKETFELGPSVNLYPFEYVLPINIPHSWIPPNQPKGFPAASVVAYRVIGFADVASKPNKITFLPFTVLAHPNHTRLDYSLVQMAPVSKSTDMRLEISGASTMWAGEQYQISVSIENRSSKAIHSLEVRLKYAHWYSARNLSGWYRVGGYWSIADGCKWNCSDLPGLPIQPGQNWTGKVQVAIPSHLSPSLHSTISPVIQNGYRIGVKLSTEGNVFTKSSGSTKFMVVMANRYTEYETLKAPVEPEGPLGKLVSAPAPPDLSQKMVPAPSLDPKQVICAGTSFGHVGQYPGAFYPVQAYVPHIFGMPFLTGRCPTPDEWQVGSVPTWLRNAAEGLDTTTDHSSINFQMDETAEALNSPSSSGAM